MTCIHLRTAGQLLDEVEVFNRELAAVVQEFNVLLPNAVFYRHGHLQAGFPSTC